MCRKTDKPGGGCKMGRKTSHRGGLGNGLVSAISVLFAHNLDDEKMKAKML